MNWHKVKEWTNDSIEYEIVQCESTVTNDSWHCGYAIVHGYLEDYERSVNVHGGITYCRQLDDGRYKYGFDCAHAFDDENPVLQDIGWLTSECERMGKQVAALLAQQEKAKAIKQMAPDNGLGAILNYLATIKLPTSKEGYKWQGSQLVSLANGSHLVLSVAVMTSIVKIKTLIDIDQLTALQSWLADNELTQWAVNYELIFNAVYSVAIVHSSIEET